MLGAVFVRGHLVFSIEDHHLEFLNKRISLYGISGLPWAPLVPDHHFGKKVDVQLTLLTLKPQHIKTQAVILREQSEYSEQMGLKFLLSPESLTALKKIIDDYGFYPTEYTRKYPRIPAMEMIETFPHNVLIRPSERGDFLDSDFIIGKISNLSPTGLLVSTQNQMALAVIPGTRLLLTIDPRGWFPSQIRFVGQVCRVLDESDPASGNLVRYFGLKIAKIDEVNRALYVDLLRDILEKIKSRSSGKPIQKIPR